MAFFYSCYYRIDSSVLEQVVIRKKPTEFPTGKFDGFVIIMVNPSLGGETNIAYTWLFPGVFPYNIFGIVRRGAVYNQ